MATPLTLSSALIPLLSTASIPAKHALNAETDAAGMFVAGGEGRERGHGGVWFGDATAQRFLKCKVKGV
eukprot:1677048-Rhodomonas_salina.2